MTKKIIFIMLMVVLFVSTNPLNDYDRLFPTINSSALKNVQFDDIGDQYSWAKTAIYFFANYGIINGMGDNKFEPQGLVTNEQVAKLVTLSFKLAANVPKTPTFADVTAERWSYPYIETAKSYFLKPINENGQRLFYPSNKATRQEIIYSLTKARRYTDNDLKDLNTLNRFSDYDKIPTEYRVNMAIAIEKGIVLGDSGTLRPTDPITRAEMAVLLYRIVGDNPTVAPTGPNTAATPTPIPEPTREPTELIVGKTSTTLAQMKQWAKAKGAHQRFIDAADIYIKYGDLTGIRPEVLYAQAAKETNFGKYTGRVKPEQNNWAGIKIKSPTGDAPEDHETFATPDDGVRAHFNHMCAYVGIAPIGTPHDRYAVVCGLDFAGTIKYVEQLGGRWAPDPNYGYNLIDCFLTPLLAVKLK